MSELNRETLERLADILIGQMHIPPAMGPHRARTTLIEYLYMKAGQRDWHGVADAANDLRELEAKHPEVKSDG